MCVSWISAYAATILRNVLMDEWELVILVDALPQGGNPGTLYVLEPEFPAER